MIALMVLIGGITRLTESGLSMTNWEPVTGWFPPMNDAQWAEEFTNYQKSPEFKKINFTMDVHEFKSIFWLEFIHRLLGRIVGLIFFIPLIYFIIKKQIDRPLALGLSGIFGLGAIQGVVGWLMVSSGLKDAPQVSQYWLVFHLSMAFILFALVFLLALQQFYKGHNTNSVVSDKTMQRFSLFVTLVIFLQIMMGGFVAGLDAGFIYNTFPYMEGQIVPDGLFPIQPWYLNIFEDIKTVQFTHRFMAFIVVFVIGAFWLYNKKIQTSKNINFAVNCLLLIICVQFILGVATLLYVVPISLASAHQMVALLLFSISLYVNYTLLRNK